MNVADIADLEKRFTYHKPFGTQPQRYEALRAKAKELATLIIQSCPPSREMSLALTKLEEGSMWANAAIARNETPPPEPEKEPAVHSCQQVERDEETVRDYPGDLSEGDFNA